MASKAKTLPSLEQFLAAHDFLGARTLLEFQLSEAPAQARTLAWLGWVHFHLGDHRRALEAYRALEAAKPADLEGLTGLAPAGALRSLKAACHFFLGELAAAVAEAGSAPEGGALRNRVLLHAHSRLGDEAAAAAAAARLSSDSKEDVLSLAAARFAAGRFQDASEDYKRVLGVHKDDTALNVAIALCCYKMDFYDLSLESLGVYLQSNPASAFAVNLKACNHFKLYNGKAAVGELKALEDAGYTLASSDILRHNLVVFRNGEGALGVLPALLDSVPEARANLAVYHLRAGRLADAAALVEDMVPQCASESLLKAAVAASLGQLVLLGKWSGASASALAGAAAALKGAHPKEALKTAKALFEAVGTSASEKDTIPGRQAMALCYFIRHQFEDCLLYLGSIRQYLPEAGDFQWNYGVALAARGRYAEAEESLLAVRSAALTADPLYCVWLARCHCMCRRARAAWELYLRRSEGEGAGGGSAASLTLLLRTIAVDCYATGQFFYSALAYDALERLEPGDGEMWAGKLGACAGVLQAVAAGSEARESLREVYSLLQMSMAGAQPGGLVHRQADALAKAMQRWAAQAQKDG